MTLIGVLEEAEFYNIADLVALVKQHIADRDAERNQVCTCSTLICHILTYLTTYLTLLMWHTAGCLTLYGHIKTAEQQIIIRQYGD